MADDLERRLEAAERRLEQAERRMRVSPAAEQPMWEPAPDQTYTRCSCGHVNIGQLSHICPPALPIIDWAKVFPRG